MGNYREAFEYAMGIEGGEFNFDSSDKGSFTSDGRKLGSKWGMTSDDLEKALGRVCTKEDMQNCTIDTPMKFYKPKYWDTIRGDEIKKQYFCNKLFESGLNGGVTSAIKILQESAGLPKSGKIDDLTLNALNYD